MTIHCLADSMDLRPEASVYLANSFQHFHDFGLLKSPEFLWIVCKIFCKMPFVLLGNVVVPKTVDIQPNLLEWRHFRDLNRISSVATRNLWLVPAISELQEPCSCGKVSSDRLRVHGRSLSSPHRYWITKSTVAIPASGFTIQLSSLSDIS